MAPKIHPKKKAKVQLKAPVQGEQYTPAQMRIVRGRAFEESRTGRKVKKELRKMEMEIQRLERHNRLLEQAGGGLQAIAINRGKIIQMGNRKQTLSQYKRQYLETGIGMPYPAYPTEQEFIVFL